MRGPRLLPVVIAAIAALILFKGIGLLTNGGYVLTGTTAAAATSGAPTGGSEGPAASAQDATMADASPTLTDTAPTLPVGPADADAMGQGAPAAQDDAAANSVAAVDAGPGTAVDCPDPSASSMSGGAVPATPSAADEPAFSGFDFVRPPADCTPDPGVNAAGDALPLVVTGDGKKVPLAGLNRDGSSRDQVMERLSERRDELDRREAALDMRQSLVEAAEKKLDQRTAELKAIEDKVGALVKQKDTAEQQQFVSVVAMYEAMKPKDAAAIFDQLEMPVLLKVARAMSPRKMGPILADMSTTKAKDLTANLAADPGQQTIAIGQQTPADLPQIVGQ